MRSAALIRYQIVSLEKANNAATNSRKCKRERIQKQGILKKAEGEDLIAQKGVNEQLEGELRQGKAISGVSRQQIARCGYCRELGHHSRTCKKKIAKRCLKLG